MESQLQPIKKNKSIKLDSSRIILQENQTPEQFFDYICGICQEVANEAQECEKCEHLFCLECINIWKQKKNICPFNCEPFILKNPHKLVRNTLSNLKFSCRFQKSGCNQQLTFNTIEQHENDCEYQIVTCSFEGCNIQIFKKDLQEHKNSCNYRNVLCNTCNYEIQMNQIDQHNCLLYLFQKIKQLEKIIESLPTKEYVNQLIKNTVPKKDFEDYQMKVEQKFSLIFSKILEIQNQPNFQKLLPRDFCNKNHQLVYMPLKDPKIVMVSCDVCHTQPVSLNLGSYRCQTCDFDRCEQCYTQHKL